MKRGNMKKSLLTVSFLMLGLEAHSQVIVPYKSFTNGGVISSLEMNQNFTYIETKLNALWNTTQTSNSIPWTNINFTGMAASAVGAVPVTRQILPGNGLMGGGALTGDINLSVNVGTAAGQIVQLDGMGKLPIIDGSQLTNLTIPWANINFAGAMAIDVGAVPLSRQVLPGVGLTGGGSLTADVNLSVDVGTLAGQIVQLDGTGKLPSVDGSQLTNLQVPWTVNGSDIYFNTGNVGIGTNTPGSQLEISEENGHAIFTVSTYSATMTDTSIIALQKATGNSMSPSSAAYGDQLGQIRFNGHNGSGFNAAATIEGYSAGSYSMSSTPSDLLFKTTPVGSVVPTERMRIDQMGNIGIGTTAPSARLQVGMNGDGSTAIANSWSVFSDKRLKKNFQQIPHVLEKLEAINGYYYQWKNGKDQSRKLGVMAQEIEKVFPEVVAQGKDGIKSVSYGHLVAPVIEGVKDLNAKIKSLEAENAALKNYLCQKDPKAPFCQN